MSGVGFGAVATAIVVARVPETVKKPSVKKHSVKKHSAAGDARPVDGGGNGISTAAGAVSRP